MRVDASVCASFCACPTGPRACIPPQHAPSWQVLRNPESDLNSKLRARNAVLSVNQIIEALPVAWRASVGYPTQSRHIPDMLGGTLGVQSFGVPERPP